MRRAVAAALLVALVAVPVGAGPTSDGADVWSHTYDPPRRSGVFHDALAGDGRPLLVGTTRNDSAADRYDGWVARPDATGGTTSEATLAEYGSGVLVSAARTDRGVYVGGSTSTETTSFGWQLFRLDDEGAVVWERTRPGGQILAVVPAPDGGVVAVSTSGVTRVAPDGSTAWRRSPNGTAYAAAALGDGTLLAGFVGDTPENDAWLAYLHPNGSTAWERRVERPGDDRLYAATAADGTAYAAGWTRPPDADRRSVFLVRANSSGVAWVRAVGPAEADATAEDATPNPSGGVVLAGNMGSRGAVFDVSATGELRATRRGADRLYGIDSAGDDGYLVAGKTGRRGFAALVSLDASGSFDADAGGDTTTADQAGGSVGGTVENRGGDRDGGPSLPSVDVGAPSFGGLAPLLYGAAAVAVLAAVAVTALSLRRLGD